MHILAVLGSVVLILIVLWDAFEVIILPRRVRRKFRLTRFFYRGTWRPWSAVAKRISSNDRRELLLSFYGPVSLLFLLSMWAAGLALGFACLYRSLEIPLKMGDGGTGFLTYLYFSGSTFFTLGLGDVLARSWTGRLLTVLEAGMGLGFLAIVIGYLPVLYQAFSRRELNISLLDARAGSPSTAAELLRRHFDGDQFVELSAFLREWERWAAELLESHLSYPVLAYYRSQHTNQSWLGALTTILDATTLVMVGIDGTPAHQAQLTFAIARHAVADLSHVFNTKPQSQTASRRVGQDAQQSGKKRHLPSGRRCRSPKAQYAAPYVRALCSRAFRVPAHAVAIVGSCLEVRRQLANERMGTYRAFVNVLLVGGIVDPYGLRTFNPRACRRKPSS